VGQLDKSLKRTSVRPTMSEVRSVRPVPSGSSVGLVGQAIGLADRGLDPPARPFELPVEPVGKAHAVLDPVVARKAVEREQVGIFQIDRPGVLVGTARLRSLRAGDHLDARGQHLGAARNSPTSGHFTSTAAPPCRALASRDCRDRSPLRSARSRRNDRRRRGQCGERSLPVPSRVRRRRSHCGRWQRRAGCPARWCG
jgi:hypothetical protein